MRIAIRFLPALVLAALIAVAASLRPSPPARPQSDTVPDLEVDSIPCQDPIPPPPDEATETLRDRRVDADERLEAVPVLVKRGSDKDWGLIRKILLDPTEDLSVRGLIVVRLGRSLNPGAFELLSDLYRSDPSFPERHLVVKAIGDLRKDVTIIGAGDFLVHALRSDHSDGVRTHAARALEEPSPVEAERRALRDAVLSDSCENVRLAALGVLVRAGGEEPFLRTVMELPNVPARVRLLAARGLRRGR